jgi:hypothetical protein
MTQDPSLHWICHHLLREVCSTALHAVVQYARKGVGTTLKHDPSWGLVLGLGLLFMGPDRMGLNAPMLRLCCWGPYSGCSKVWNTFPDRVSTPITPPPLSWHCNSHIVVNSVKKGLEKSNEDSISSVSKKRLQNLKSKRFCLYSCGSIFPAEKSWHGRMSRSFQT